MASWASSGSPEGGSLAKCRTWKTHVYDVPTWAGSCNLADCSNLQRSAGPWVSRRCSLRWGKQALASCVARYRRSWCNAQSEPTNTLSRG